MRRQPSERLSSGPGSKIDILLRMATLRSFSLWQPHREDDALRNSLSAMFTAASFH
ncbi:MAG: hypothetical protein IPL05_05445 [Betaproteobacteria bacterium]|nr:hypothetical protein [Betaproteobacteria bacterium]